MKHLLALCLFVASTVTASAQNWQGVITGDTTYYSVTDTTLYYYRDSTWLRVAWVDSSKLNTAGDSVHYFVPSVRGTQSQQCVDTASGNLLGRFYIRRPGGTELYFNETGDTITINTLAGLGTTWNIAKDISGNIIKGTVSGIGTTIIDGTTDSIRNISLQAYSGGTPISSFYNGKTIVLSKAHGWQALFEWYGFPNAPYRTSLEGSHHIPFLHHRVPAGFARTDFSKIDLPWKYAPGNEWIYWFTTPLSYQPTTIATHDSIISSTPLTPTSIKVTTQSDIFVKITVMPGGAAPYDSTSTLTIVHTDTISNIPSHRIPQKSVFPETKTFAMSAAGGMHDPHYQNYLIDTMLCGLYCLKNRIVSSEQYLGLINGCYRNEAHVSGYLNKDTDRLERFGIIAIDFYQQDLPLSDQYHDRFFHTYIKVGGCAWGTKINVIKLAVADPKHQSQSFIIQPNPANGSITISPKYLFPSTVVASLYTTTGKLILQQSLAEKGTQITTSDIPAGVYFIEIRTATGREMQKVIVEH